MSDNNRLFINKILSFISYKYRTLRFYLVENLQNYIALIIYGYKNIKLVNICEDSLIRRYMN